MKLSQQTVKSFVELHKHKSGVTLGDQEAIEMASDLLASMDQLYRKVSKADEQKLKDYRY